MVSYKNQHYVPRWLLSSWASDVALDFLHLPTGRIFNENERNVCSGDYFYGTPYVEQKLKPIEDNHARPVTELRKGKSIGALTNKLGFLLRSFVSTQRTRTKSTRTNIESGEDFLREAVRTDLASGNYENIIEWKHDLNDAEKEDSLVDASIKGIHHRQLINGIFGFITLADMSGVILRNATDREFLISDAPIVHDNPRYKNERDLVRGGLANRGLQIFCPIDRNRILLLYDPVTYSFIPNANGELIITSNGTVDLLNLFQYHNAEDIVIFKSSEKEYVSQLANQIEEVRRREEISQKLQTETGDTITHEYIPSYQIPLRSPTLPSCKTARGLAYAQRRINSGAERQRQLTSAIFRKARQATDAALIYAIHLFNEILENRDYHRLLSGKQSI